MKKDVHSLKRYARKYIAEGTLAARMAIKARAYQYPEIKALRTFLNAFSIDCILDV